MEERSSRATAEEPGLCNKKRRSENLGPKPQSGSCAAASKPVKIEHTLSQGPSLHPQAPPQLCLSFLQLSSTSVGGSHTLKLKKHPLCAWHPKEGCRDLSLKRDREGGVPTPTLLVWEVYFLL